MIKARKSTESRICFPSNRSAELFSLAFACSYVRSLHSSGISSSSMCVCVGSPSPIDYVAEGIYTGQYMKRTGVARTDFAIYRLCQAMNFASSIFLLQSILVTAFAQTGPEVASYFRKHLSNSSTVYLPSESNYSFETTQRWNAFSAPTYIISVKPSTDVDIQKIVCLFGSIAKLGQSTKLHR